MNLGSVFVFFEFWGLPAIRTELLRPRSLLSANISTERVPMFHLHHRIAKSDDKASNPKGSFRMLDLEAIDCPQQ